MIFGVEMQLWPYAAKRLRGNGRLTTGCWCDRRQTVHRAIIFEGQAYQQEKAEFQSTVSIEQTFPMLPEKTAEGDFFKEALGTNE